MNIEQERALLPCPFCGGANIEIQTSTPDREGTPTHLMCAVCGAAGPWSYERGGSYTVSAALWNARAALQSQVKNDMTLFCDLKTDEEKSAFFLSGRGYETGVIAKAIQNDVAMAYHRCAEFKKELETLQSQDREDAERYRTLVATGHFVPAPRPYFSVWGLRTTEGKATKAELDEAIDHARRVEGDGE